MRITLVTLTACILVLSAASERLAGQSVTPPAQAGAAVADAAATLRGRDVFSEQDKQQLRQWIDAKVQALAEASKSGDPKAIQVARRQLIDAVGQGATPGFRVAFADACATIFPPYLGTGSDARGGDPRVALYLIQVLGPLKQTSSLDTLLAALGSKHPAVRYWAARSIRDIRTELKGNLMDRAVAELVKAGAKEGYPAAAQVMYDAVDIRGQVPGSTPKVIAAWLDMLNGRLQFYSNDREDLAAEFYPDANVLAQLTASPDLTDADKKRAGQIAYAIIEQCVVRWAAVGRLDESTVVEVENPYDPSSVREWHVRYQLARATQEAESLLRKLYAAGATAPDVAKLMTDLSTGEQVHAAFEKWQPIVQPATAPVAAATRPGN
jgi:hypothetical protein